MEKIDRLGWAAGISLTSYGVRIGIRVNDPKVLDRLPDYLPPEWKPAESLVVDRLYSLIIGGASARTNVRRFNILYGDISKLVRTVDDELFFDAFESDLQLHVAEWARRRVFVHCGVVGYKGRAILVPGRSHSGKTTLIAELVRAGAVYYSDEYAVLDAQGHVHPYSRPLAVREEAGGKQTKREAQFFGGVKGFKPLPVGLVVSTHHKPGARWRPKILTPGKGLLELLANTVSARRQPERALATLQRVVSVAPVLKGARGEAAETVAAIFKTMEKRAANL